MSIVRLPQRFTSQPQYSPSLSWEYRDAEFLTLFNSSARDLAKGNPLSSSVTPSRVVRQHGKALAFNGAFLDSARVVKQGPLLTVFAWVRPTAANAGYARVLETQYSSGFFLGGNTGSQYAFIVNGASLEGCIGGQQVIGQRDFLCGVFDGTNRILYVNGVAVASASATSPVAADLLRIGESNAGGSFPWNGDIDTVGVFPRAFSAAQVRSLYLEPWRLVKAPDRRIQVSVSSGYTLTASSGSFDITGTAAALKYNRVLPASSGSFAIIGTAATLKRGYSLQAASGSVAVSGTAASLKLAKVLQAGSGSVAVTGTAATLTLSSNKTLQADSGSIAVTGSAATLKVFRVLPAASGSVQIGATAASLKYSRLLSADPGSFGISGTDATLTYQTAGNRTLVAGDGSFAISGAAANLRLSRQLSVGAGSFTFSGTAATLRYARKVIAEAGGFSISGTDAILTYSGVPPEITSTVERTAIFRAIVARNATFQRSKSVSVKFN